MRRTARRRDASGRLEGTLKSHTSVVTAVAVSPDGTRIVSGSRDNTVRVRGYESLNSAVPAEGLAPSVTVGPHAELASSSFTVSVVLAIVSVIAAVVFLFAGGLTLALVHDIQNPPPATCDGHVMQSGEECVSVQGGQVVSDSGRSAPDVQRDTQEGTAIFMVIVGAVAAIAAVVALLCGAVAIWKFLATLYHFGAARMEAVRRPFGRG